MKVLMVEDNQFKVDNILSYISSTFQLQDIVVKKSYNTALNEILSGNDYNLILLDISIPNFDYNSRESSGEFMPLGGKHLLSQIFLQDLRAKVIVVTMFENFNDGSEMKELDQEFKRKYVGNYLGYVLYSNLDSKWKIDLRNFIQKLL